MTFIEQIKTGDKVEITMKSQKSDEKLISRVETVSKHHVLVHAPIKNGQVVKLSTDARYNLLFINERAQFRFEAVVKRHSKVDGFNVVSFKLTTAGEKMQRRAFFRFNCLIPLQFELLNEEGETVEEEGEAVAEESEAVEEVIQKGLMRDISGGGMRLLTQCLMQENDIIRATLHLGKDVLQVFGRILAREELPEQGKYLQYHVKFRDISKKDQEKIVQFVYNEQRKVMQRTK